MRQRIETRVLSGLKDRLLTPELVAQAVRVFADELATAQKEAGLTQSGLKRQVAEVERSPSEILKAVEAAPGATRSTTG